MTEYPPDFDNWPIDQKNAYFADETAKYRKRKVTEPRPKPNGQEPVWLRGAVRDEGGRVLPILANVALALRRAPDVGGFAFDEMARATIVTSPLPRVESAPEVDCGPYPRPLRDTDVSQLQEVLQHRGLPKLGRDTTHQAVDLRAKERAFHPVRDWLNSLTWDGRRRLDGWLVRYLGAERTAYAAEVGKLFLISMVARIYEPGCKCDYMLILEGDQGVFKSSACRVLAGDEWFTDALPDIRDRDRVAQHLRGKWLVEISELSAISRADAETLKVFLSRTDERYRPPYGREEVHEPRQCVFIGTTNKSAYLMDNSGARRSWPVKIVALVDLDALNDDRDQLFAEAAAAYRAGAKWWPEDDFEREHIKPQQDLRFEADAWEEPIRKYLAGRERVAVVEVATGALGFDTAARVGTRDQRRIASVLTQAGWRAVRDHSGRGYISPDGLI